MKNRFVKNIIVISMFVAFAITSIACEKSTAREFNVNDIKKVSNLNTLKCHFKNVAVIDVSSLGGIRRERQMIEYLATIELGISLKEVEYDALTKTLTIPKPKVMSKNYDEESITNKYQKYFIFSGLNIDMAYEEISKSLDELVETVEKNDSIMNRAQNLAAAQIDALIKNMFIDTKNVEFNYLFR